MTSLQLCPPLNTSTNYPVFGRTGRIIFRFSLQGNTLIYIARLLLFCDIRRLKCPDFKCALYWHDVDSHRSVVLCQMNLILTFLVANSKCRCQTCNTLYNAEAIKTVTSELSIFVCQVLKAGFLGACQVNLVDLVFMFHDFRDLVNEYHGILPQKTRFKPSPYALHFTLTSSL